MLEIFNMHNLNEILFLKISFSSIGLALYLPQQLLKPLFLLTEHWPLNKPFTSIHVFVTNFDTVEDILWYSIFIILVLIHLIFLLSCLGELLFLQHFLNSHQASQFCCRTI